jgi:hypothetical protein
MGNRNRNRNEVFNVPATFAHAITGKTNARLTGLNWSPTLAPLMPRVALADKPAKNRQKTCPARV